MSQNRILIGLLLSIGMVLPAVPAAEASIVDWVEAVGLNQIPHSSPPIVVESDGTKYTVARTSQVGYRMRRTGRCKSPSRVAVSRGYIHRIQSGQWWQFQEYFNTGLVDKFRSVDQMHHETIQLTKAEKTAAVAACNANLSALQRRGWSKGQVLGQDQVIPGPQLFRARHYFGCDGHLLNSDAEEDSLVLENRVRCEKSPAPPSPVGPGNIVQRFGVTAAAISVTPDKQTVVTQGTVTVHGQLTANGPGPVRFHVVRDGRRGPLNTLQFSKAGTKSFHFDMQIPCGSQGSGGGGGTDTLTSPLNSKSGSVRIDVVSPTSGVRKSNQAFYSVTCRQTGTVAPSLPDLRIKEASFEGGLLTAVVRNGGSASANATLLRITVPGAMPVNRAVPGLQSGSETEIKVELGPARAGAAIRLKVDPSNTVSELNERNNGFTLD